MGNLRIEILSGYEAQTEDSRTHNQPKVELASRRAYLGERAVQPSCCYAQSILNLFCFLDLVWNEKTFITTYKGKAPTASSTH